MWKMLQQKEPQIIIATGKQYSVKEFVNLTLNQLEMKFKWKGQGINSSVLMKKILHYRMS